MASGKAVQILNGTARTVPVGEIGSCVCEDANPGNEKEVAAVEVELPALKALAAGSASSAAEMEATLGELEGFQRGLQPEPTVAASGGMEPHRPS